MAVIKRERAAGIRYEVRVFNKAANGQVHVGTFSRRKDALEAEAEAKRRLKLGERPVREEILFSDLARKWLSGRRGVRQSTRDDYRVSLQHVLPRLGSMLVSNIGRRDVDDLLADLSIKYAPNTVRKTIVVLKMVLRSAVDWEYIDRIPTGESRLSLPRVPKRQFRPLEPVQVRRLIDCAPEYWRPWFITAVTTGLRRGEMFGLTWTAVDLQRGELFVRQQLIGDKLVEPKSDSAHRRIPLPAATLAALQTHQLTCPSSRLNLVFPMPSGAAVCPGNWYRRVFVPTRIQADLPALRVHDLRHVYASALIRQGRSIKYVQSVMGHSDASITLNVYGWLYPDEGERAAADMDKWLAMEACLGMVDAAMLHAGLDVRMRRSPNAASTHVSIRPMGIWSWFRTSCLGADIGADSSAQQDHAQSGDDAGSGVWLGRLRTHARAASPTDAGLSPRGAGWTAG